MTDYTCRCKRFEASFDKDGNIVEPDDSIEIADDAVALSTTATHSNPPIVVASWLEPAGDEA